MSIGRTPDSSVCSADEGVLKVDVVLATIDIPGACFPLTEIHGVLHTTTLSTTNSFIRNEFVRGEARQLVKQRKLYWLNFANYLLLDDHQPEIGVYIRRPPGCEITAICPKNPINVVNHVIHCRRMLAKRTNAYIHPGKKHAEVFSTRQIKKGDEVFADTMTYIYDLLDSDLDIDLAGFAIDQHIMLDNPRFVNHFYVELEGRHGIDSPLNIAYDHEIKRIFSGAKMVRSTAALDRARLLILLTKVNLVLQIIYCSNQKESHFPLQRFMDPMIYFNIVNPDAKAPTKDMIMAVDIPRFLGLLTCKQVGALPLAQQTKLFTLAKGLGYGEADFRLILKGAKVSRLKSMKFSGHVASRSISWPNTTPDVPTTSTAPAGREHPRSASASGFV